MTSPEVFAPTGSTFAEGNDVIGFGTTLPPELASFAPYNTDPTYFPKSALVFYSSDWNPAATYGQTKFTFVTFVNDPTVGPTQGNGLLLVGAGFVANASLDTTAVIRMLFSGATGSSGQDFSVWNHLNTLLMDAGENNTPGSDGSLLVYNAAKEPTVALVSNVIRNGTPVGRVATYDQTGNAISAI